MVEESRMASSPGQVNSGDGTAYGRLAEFLRQQIVAGVLKPNDRLPAEPELSDAYQVSRNTAREALRVLASQGFVTSKRGTSGGTFVAHPSTDQLGAQLGVGLGLLAESEAIPLEKLIEAREMLEVPAAEIAAMRRTDEELAELQRCLDDTSPVAPDGTYEHNRAFHGVLLRATHNPVIEVIAEPVFEVLHRRMDRESLSSETHQWVNDEHREIAQAIEARDPLAAREATRAHLRSLRRLYSTIDKRATRDT
ncbi:FadR family transcriptional regulator [Nocardioides carbamazepini]|uniref:FadR/GntR family transcriptional regulator n=1 Tax=Nocardioides carbamazepini TaxID=2854259 RepID=UPI002149D5C0|nr:FadR/GntR family transcriptional regulator [Nocardioides carbamazepini]MCR1786695.1 FadR family transcriptional regulator [Nocardioides carbamazepini]